MNSKARRTAECMTINEMIGKNLSDQSSLSFALNFAEKYG